MFATANSMAMNNPYGPSLLPIWVIIMIVLCVVIFAALGVWGFFVIWNALKNKKDEQISEENTAVTENE